MGQADTAMRVTGLGAYLRSKISRTQQWFQTVQVGAERSSTMLQNDTITGFALCS